MLRTQWLVNHTVLVGSDVSDSQLRGFYHYIQNIFVGFSVDAYLRHVHVYIVIIWVTCNVLAVVAGTPRVPDTKGAWPICAGLSRSAWHCRSAWSQKGRDLFWMLKCQLKWNVTSGLAFKASSTF